jgi:hypothetical protein
MHCESLASPPQRRTVHLGAQARAIRVPGEHAATPGLSNYCNVLLLLLQVENLQALNNFESVASEADALLLSRGNLGLDVPPEKIAIVQKAAITRCNILGKPVILTRFVDSMTSAPRCTR